MSSPSLKNGGFVSFRVDPVAYQSRLELCKNALIRRVVISSGKHRWVLVDIKAISKLWMISRY